jgi:hypothetical protein
MKWFGGRFFAAVSVALLELILVGCGGGGGDSGSGDSSGQSQISAPSNIAGQEIALNGTASREINFESTGNIWTEDRNGTVHGGTYQYSPSGSSAQLVLNESGAESTIRLTFTSPESGGYVAEQEQGTFQLQSAQSNPNGGGSTSGGDGQQGPAPASLDGRTIYGTRTFTSTGPVGQTHTYTFSGDNFHDSDPPEETDGKFLYEPAGDHASLTLIYYSPKEFNGDRHELHFTFVSEGGGTFESVYTRRDGTIIQINGTFQLE